MITDSETGWTEADITINDTQLTFAQSMVIRVAIGSFLMQVTTPEFRKGLGPVAVGYERILREVSDLIHDGRSTVAPGPQSENLSEK